MRTNYFKTLVKAAVSTACILLFGAAAAFGQQQINLTAAPTTTTLPDGTTVPMWGYFCTPLATGVSSTATCAALNPAAATLGQWSPVVITVPTGATGGLLINLTNNLSFTPTGSTTPNTIPTSIMIVGQVGGGLGNASLRTTAASPNHTDAQGCVSWFIANTSPGQPCGTASPIASPPVQGPRVQSFGAEVSAVAATTAATCTSPSTGPVTGCGALTWSTLRPGTYLLESGTHPSIQVPMGLIGVLVVTTAPSGGTAGTAYPTTPPVPYNAEVPVEFSEIDPMQNKAVDTAVRTVGFSETAVWTAMNGIGPVASITVNTQGSGYTSAPMVTIAPPPAVTGAMQATASATLTFTVTGVSVATGGTGYTAGDVLTLVGGTGTAAQANVLTVDPTNSNAILTVAVSSSGSYSVAPTSPVAVTGGTGSGATLNATTNGSVSAITITNAGDGYTTAPNVSIALPTTGVGATATAATGASGCGVANTCYPPAVNYTPFYYLINGVAFNKTNPANSLFAATAGVTSTAPFVPVTTGITGTVLVRMVNAGLRMHVPSIVGSLTQGFNGAGGAAAVGGFTLIAEDGNVIPGVAAAGVTAVPAAPRVQTDVFMAAGKVFDVLINAPTIPSGGTAPPALPVYDRALSLSGNSSTRDAGMLAYININNGGLPAVSTGVGGAFASAKAVADTYNSLASCATTATSCTPLVISDVSKGVIANDINVYGVQLLTPPTGGTLTCTSLGTGLCENGTFTYTPNPGTTADGFSYCANNGLVTTTTPPSCPGNLTAQVNLGLSGLKSTLTAGNLSYTSTMATFLKIPSPGLLVGGSDSNNLPFTVVTSGANAPTLSGGTLVVDSNGGFTASVPAAGTYTFNYQLQNSLGQLSTPGTGTVTLTFPTASNLAVNVVDAQAYNNCQGASSCISGLTQIIDYRWIIEEDKTFWVDPNCIANTSATAPGCPAIVGPSGTSTIPTFGVNFHTSNMDFVAQGCTGQLSCEGGQTMLDNNPSSATFGQHIPAVCDLGNGACRPDPTGGNGFTPVQPGSVHLDPSKRYYISVLPGDAANPFPSYTGQPGCDTTTGALPAPNPTTGVIQCGHTMSGAPVPPACNVLTAGCNSTNTTATFAPVTVLTLPTPLPTGKLSVMVFEDDFPLNGEQDSGGGVDVLSPNEPGLGGFNIVLWDTYGGLGDVTGQDTYDMFNQPLSNSLAGTIDPGTGLDACPISANSRTLPGQAPSPTGITGMIVTCPKYESDGKTLSPLAGQAVIANLMPEKFSVQAYPASDRIARGEEWIQTNTLDGQHAHDSFIRIGEPSYFQEYGPAGYHVSIGFANPAIINARHDAVCAGAYGAVGPCQNTITGQVDVQRSSRTPDQRLYPSGSRDALAWTQCWVSLGDPDAEDFMFTKCDAQGNFTFNNVPGGNWRVTIGDQWNDQIIDGISTPANVGCVPVGTAKTCTGGINPLNLGSIGVQQWQSNLYTRTFIDDNKNGIWDPGEIGIPLIYTRIRYRDGHNSNSLTTDFNGIASFNETFPLFNWYVVESDPTRYKTTGIHTVYDAGGPADGSPSCASTARPCGSSTAYNFLANTFEGVPLPADLSVPGAVYCAKADCTTEANADFANGTPVPSSSTASTGRIDPPWVGSEGWSGMTSQGNWIEFGKAPYASCPPACATVTVTAPGSTTATTTKVGENGGIQGNVEYASTRPFDSAEQMIQQPWEPFVPHVTVNLYQEGFAADGVTPTLTLVDTTKSSSWDDWAQGFYPNYTDPATGTALPYMSCPGQGKASGANADLFFYTLFGQPNYLDLYNSQHNGGTLHTLPYNSQYKCYDAMHVWNQIQPAPFDGKYSFPSVLGINPAATIGTGWLNTSLTGGVGGNGPGTPGFVAASMPGTNCTICVPNPTTATKPASGDLSGYDPYRAGTPMLPPGKYVVQVIMPSGYEVYKEEDKNLLIGDNYIAPISQQFAGLGGDIFIIPDQAAVASLYDPNNVGYNPSNFQNSTTGLSLQGGMLSGVPGYPGFTDPVWPCVGEMRVVPDYLSLFPHALEVAPFAGATRPLCDRKEVTLTNQVAVQAKFAIFTSTHIASKFTGVITDDFTSEFDPFAPQFGEKFAPPNMPISTRDYLGNEISRVYSDQFGIYDGLNFSSWAVNPPNITGYSPSIMVQCMNDPGPLADPNHPGQFINDPLYNPAYSNFCYEEPYMPGLTTYLDTPVVPTQAFVGAGYNNADCAYPDATPAISEVDGDGLGPWVSQGGNQLTITALGNATVANASSCTIASSGADVGVTNASYSGPSASVAPFNCKNISRHYGFGAQCTSPTAGSATCNTASSVTIGGVPATITGWGDTSITVTVPAVQSAANPKGVPPCTVQQQAQYANNGSGTNYGTAYCGELVIKGGNGKRSIDAVTVTIGGKAPTHVPASGTIQSAIDTAAPGDLIIVDPTCATATGLVSCGTTGAVKSTASHTEMLIMWKPVRLQGVGAASTIINANTHPAGKLLDPWRRHINCLFGLTLQGAPSGNTTPYDPSTTFNCPESNWQYFSGSGQTVTGGTVTASSSPQIDRMPSEGTLGWDTTLNGNLAELLQEPSLMGAYEGAGITVLAKGVEMHGADPFASSLEGAFPTGTTLLSGVVSNPGGEPGSAGSLSVGDDNPLCHTVTYNPDGTVASISSQTNPYPSNFICNPSSIDGLSVTNSSQGGGGIFIHGWANYLRVANNRVYNNAGTLSGGISVGQGEFGPPYTQGGGLANLPPGSCSDGTGFVTNQHLPWCLDLHVDVHNNMITDNSSIGDELFSATLSGGGGATICTGNDYYKFNYNWVCGNLSSGEGGGVVHLGEIFNGQIQYNAFVFNQSSNPTIPTNGGGIMVQGTPDTDPTCPGVPDTDCPSGLSDGTGPGLVINGNLIQGNSADSGSGGGIRLQQVNGTGVGTFPNPRPANTIPGNAAPDCTTQYTSTGAQNCLWNVVSITNNVIDNNMAGWDGAGISLQDTLVANIINNTIVHNDSLASSGVLTTSIGAPQASAPSTNCHNAGGTASCPQSAGVTSTLNSTLLGQAMAGLTITCPSGHTNCTHFSNPILYNNIIWQNRSFNVGVGGRGAGNLNQQNLVTLFNGGTSTLAPSQTFTGMCSAGVTYWDLGVRGDTNAAGHQSGFTMSPIRSVLSSGGYSGTGDVTTEPSFVSEYCNGSRVPPECTVSDGCGGPNGFGVPPGIADAVTPNPVFSLTPSATVDEGNNWINVSWGPLSLTNPSLTGGQYGNYGGGLPLGNYALLPSSDLIDTIPCPGGAPCLPSGEIVAAPTTDYFGNPRPDATGSFDPGAIESVVDQTAAAAPTLTLISPNSGLRGTAVHVTLEGTNLIGATINPIENVTISGVTVLSSTQVAATFTISGTAALGPRTVTVTTSTGTSNGVTFTVVARTLTSISPNSRVRGGTSFPVTLTGTSLTGVTAVTVSGTGVTASAVTVVSDTTVTATFTILSTATVGLRNVTVSGAGSTSNAVTFTVGPFLTAISPTSGVRGAPVNVTVTGVGLTGATAVTVSGTNVTVGNFVAVNDTTVTATFTIASGATLGGRTVAVVTPAPGGSSNTVTFTVTGATVTFSGQPPALNSGGTGTKTGTITVSNAAGATSALTLTAAPTVVKTAGPASGSFSITGGSCFVGPFPLVINAGGSCTVTVQYVTGGSTLTSTAHLSLPNSGASANPLLGPNFNAN